MAQGGERVQGMAGVCNPARGCLVAVTQQFTDGPLYASVPQDNFVPVATSSNCLVGGADTNRLVGFERRSEGSLQGL